MEGARKTPRGQIEQDFVYRRTRHATNLDDMRQSGELCDVTIKINDRKFRAHKVILAGSLGYFRTLFKSSFRESTQETIVMTTVNESIMEKLISFAYTGEIRLNDQNVLSLLQEADYLNEEDVKEACVGYLCRNVKPEMAIQVFELGYALNLTILKESAKQTILSNFAELSFTPDFFDLDFPVLQEILTSDEVHSSEPRQYFERIVEWVMYDLPRRRAYLKDLLGLVCVAELTAGYLIGYLYESISPDDDAVIRDIMSFYLECIDGSMPRRKRAKSQMRLITIDRAMLSHIQTYNFETNTWSLHYTNLDHKHYTVSTVFKNYLFIVGGRTDVACVADVKIYDPRTGQVHSSPPMTVARRDCAIGSSSNYLFVCGGRNDDGLALNLVERYGSKIGVRKWDTLTPMNVPRYNAAFVVFQECIYVIGGSAHDGEELNVVEKYDPASGQWTMLEPMHHRRVSFGLAVLNGKLYACGGWDKNSVEVYDPRSMRWQECPSMQKKRDSFLVVAYDGKLVATGGDTDRSNPTMEIYNPDTRQWRFLETRGLHNKYLTGGLIQV